MPLNGKTHPCCTDLRSLSFYVNSLCKRVSFIPVPALHHCHCGHKFPDGSGHKNPVGVLQRNRINRIYTIYREKERERLVIRNWLAWLWRLRSPKICKLSSKRAGDINSSLSVSPKLGEDQCPSSKIIRQREQILSCSVFCSIQAFNRLDEAHPCWGGQCALLSLPFQILISPRHIHTPRILFTQISGHPTSQSGGHTKLTVTSGLCWLTWSHSLGRALCGNTCSYQKLLQYQCTVIKPSLRSAVSKELKRYIKKCGAEMLS